VIESSGVQIFFFLTHGGPSYTLPGRRYPMAREQWVIEAGKALRTLRRARGLSCDDLAERAGVVRKTVERFERGENWPGLRVRSSLAVALGMSPEALTILLLRAGCDETPKNKGA